MPTHEPGITFVLPAPGSPTGQEWKVMWEHQICAPSWPDRGAAEVYLARLREGLPLPQIEQQG